jgi:transposase
MIQLVPQHRILLACRPVDFRAGIDALAALCKRELHEDPYSGCIFCFRNRRGTSLRLLVYDGLGFWLVTRRFSKGRLRWWPSAQDTPIHPFQAHQLSVLLFNGLPEQAQFAPAWRALKPQSLQPFLPGGNSTAETDLGHDAHPSAGAKS